METPAPLQNSAPEAQEPKRLNEAARLVSVFLSPGKVFADLNRKPRWWVPFVLLVVCNLALTFTIDRTIGFTGVAEQSIRANSKAADQLEQLPPDQRAGRIAIVAKFIKYASFASPVTLFLLAIALATVLIGTFNFGLGKELRFGPSLAVVLYAMLPGVVYTLLMILVLALSSRPQDVNVQNMVATNAAFFFDQSSTPHALYTFLRLFDIFSLWQVILAGIGFSAIGGGRRSTTLTVVFGWWLLLVLGMSGLALLR